MTLLPCKGASGKNLRPALSLLEVIIALAIFLSTLTVIAQLVSIGGNRALEVRLENQATRLCQSKLAEIISGAIPLSSTSDTPFDEDPDFTWSLDAQQGTFTGLWQLQIKVSYARDGGPPIQCSVYQMVMDPSLRGSPVAPTSSSTSNPNGTTQDGSSTGTGTTAAVGGAGATKGGTGATKGGGGGTTGGMSKGGGKGG